jgi:hypothetical protein
MRSIRTRTRRRLIATLSFSAALWLPVSTRAEGIVDALTRRFAQSDFQFLRAQSNAPFVPLAWVDTEGYHESELERPDGTNSGVTFKQASIEEGLLVPVAFTKRDAFVVGEWVSWTHMDLQHAARKDLDILSVAIPIGWIQQSTPDWQLAAFVAPLGHKTHEDSWYWETLGGVFGRHLSSDRFAWIVGVYFDVSPLEDFYIPYLGATYVINERWTLNAVLPWPCVTYAPTSSTFFRFGVSPSGASWSAQPGEREPRVSLSAWNIGLGAEHRIYGNMWLGGEVGASALRGMTLQGTQWQNPETKLDGTGYVSLTLNWRVNP